MTKAEEILEKHLENNPDQRIYLKGSKLTYNLCIDAINEAINYAPCSLQLKDKEKMTFDDWVKTQGYTKTKSKDEYRKGMIISDAFNLKHSYTKYLNL